MSKIELGNFQGSLAWVCLKCDWDLGDPPSQQQLIWLGYLCWCRHEPCYLGHGRLGPGLRHLCHPCQRGPGRSLGSTSHQMVKAGSLIIAIFHTGIHTKLNTFFIDMHFKVLKGILISITAYSRRGHFLSYYSTFGRWK